MTRTRPESANGSDELLAALADLALPAPEELARAALTAVGLADLWAELPSPLGPIGVVWNGRGISWIDRADEADLLVKRFESRVGRPLHRVDRVASEKDQGRRCDLEAGMAKLLGARVAWAAADGA